MGMGELLCIVRRSFRRRTGGLIVRSDDECARHRAEHARHQQLSPGRSQDSCAAPRGGGRASARGPTHQPETPPMSRDDYLTPEAIEVIESARAMVPRLAARAEAAERDGRVPAETIREMQS